jgi:thymidylate synthase
MSEGFPLLTTKKMHWKSIVSELLWFLRGETNIKSLLEEKNTIWVGDSYKKYLKSFENITTLDEPYNKEDFIEKILNNEEFSKKWGELGPIYGRQWRKWEKYGYRGIQNGAVDSGLITQEEVENEIYVDQIQNLINDLKTNPDSRRLMVNAWNCADLNKMVLPPCHYGFQLYTRELDMSERWKLANLTPNMSEFDYCNKICDDYNVPNRAISLMWNQRSVDTPLGLPFNIASYGLLLVLLGKITNMIPEKLIGNLADTHIYLNQIDGVKEQIERSSYGLPTLLINDEFWPTETQECGVGDITNDFDFLIKNIKTDDFQLLNYKSNKTIKYPLSN